MLMMTPDGQPTDWDELPLYLDDADMAVLLRKCQRTIRRRRQLGQLPATVQGGWSRDEVKAWFDAGGPEREVWERIRPKRFRRE